MGKKVFTKKEINKLLFSETLKRSNLPWLMELLKNNKNLSYSDLNVTQKQILNEMRSDLLNNSIEEWGTTLATNNRLTLDLGPNEEKWVKCQLCGTKNRYIHYIKNKITKNVINVGSDCIEEFGAIGEIAHKDKRNLVSDQIKNRRLLKLLETIPDAKSRIENWNKFLGEIDIVLPNRIEMPYINLGKKAEKLFKSILSKSQNEKEVHILKTMFLKQNEFKEKILKYVDRNKNRTFVMTREIDSWLKFNKANEYARIREVIKQSGNGFITSEIAYEINEPKFLKMIANEYNKNIDNNIMKVEHVTNNGFVISVYPFLNIYLEITNRVFTNKYGKFAFGEKNEFDIEFLLTNSRCYRNKDRDKLIDELKKMLSHVGMKIVKIDMKNNRMDIEYSSKKIFIRFELEKFIESNKHHIYLNKHQELQTVIIKNNNTFSEWEYRNLVKKEKDIKEVYYGDTTKKKRK
ncbi:hypothetical protein [Bacillus sp. EB600]|uniref:hypothetical protein n=1 Tax=Bacillus sp. EB600 TaxID=2806345 RepID=UPI00210DEB0F|nr:hypothetical protein [Bacillus sp. EB600]MCQ6281076.1 hypothetical protein [Bacillus sp. EB600]